MNGDRYFDLTIAHVAGDELFAQSLGEEIRKLDLTALCTEVVVNGSGSFVLACSDTILNSRCLVLVLSRNSERPWVGQGWSSFMARNGRSRIQVVEIDETEVPAILAPFLRFDARDRDAAKIARELARVIGKPDELPEGDPRCLVIRQDLAFEIGRDGNRLTVTCPDGQTFWVTPPWQDNTQFTVARLGFTRLASAPVTESGRAELIRHATTLGEILFDLLFDYLGPQLLARATIPGRPRPLITVVSEDDSLLSLPWELISNNGDFLVHEGQVDLACSTAGEVGAAALLGEPADHFKLVANVSAPSGSGLDYEGESYRITRALSEHCSFVPTELGTVEDLVETVRRVAPDAIHFSGRGAPGQLEFENDEGDSQWVPVRDLLVRLRKELPGELPRFFYLASCHGNDHAVPEEGTVGSESSAACLHREGVPQVVGYYGPITDELATRSEVALYRAIAEGKTTRYAVRQARAALARPLENPGSGTGADPRKGAAKISAEQAHSFPFAWAQLVLYHRGPDQPLSLPVPADALSRVEATLHRAFTGSGDRRRLAAGFIGRRGELHRIRQRTRRGDRVLVLQGLGGLGKSTLAFHVLPMLGKSEQICTLWCQESGQPDRAEALVAQLLEFCRSRFGAAWEQVVYQVDRAAGDDPARRFSLFLQALTDKVEELVLYFDSLDSLLVGVATERDETAFADWSTPTLAAIWQSAVDLAGDSGRLFLVASCRYRNQVFGRALVPLSPLPADAMYRMLGWFPALRRLCPANRARLVGRLAGHPRAVEFAETLVGHHLAAWEQRRGDWPAPADEHAIEHEWQELVEPALPRVRERLWTDLLLAEIWDQVLDERARRMLYRMTLLRRPWQWDLMQVLGEPDEPEADAESTAKALDRASLLDLIEIRVQSAEGKAAAVREYTLHPATSQFVISRFGEDQPLCLTTHRRVGGYLEAKAKSSPSIEVIIEAGHHLLNASEFDRACDLLGSASEWLRVRGRVREGLHILQPFLDPGVHEAMRPQLVGRLLGTAGLAHAALGEVEEAIGLYDQRLVGAHETGDRRSEGVALGNLGLAHAVLGEVEKAIDFHERALIISREIGDRSGEAADLGNLGAAFYRLGEVGKATGFYEQALIIAREIGDRRGEGGALGNLGLAHAALGELEKAIRVYEQQLVLVREIEDRRGEGNALGNLGASCFGLGKLEKAIGFYEQALMISREISDRSGEAADLGNLGAAYSRLGEVEKAMDFHEQALVIARNIRDRRSEASALTNLGIALSQLGNRNKATELLEQSIRIAKEIGDPSILRLADGHLSRLSVGPTQTTTESAEAKMRDGNRLVSAGAWQKGLARLREALDLFRGTQDIAGKARAFLGIGDAHLKFGDYEMAWMYFRDAVKNFDLVSDERGVAAARLQLGIAELKLRRSKAAIEHLKAASHYYNSHNDQLRSNAAETLIEFANRSDQTLTEEALLWPI